MPVELDPLLLASRAFERNNLVMIDLLETTRRRLSRHLLDALLESSYRTTLLRLVRKVNRAVVRLERFIADVDDMDGDTDFEE